MDWAKTKFDAIEILVNNAAVLGPIGCLENVAWQQFKETIETDLFGPILMCRTLLPHFKARHAGKIINISGGGASGPLPFLSAYAAAKSALVRFTETLAQETKDCGIAVNAIAPGVLNTRMLDQIVNADPALIDRDYQARMREEKTSGGASIERAAQLAVFLASSASNGITGKLISAVWDDWETLAVHLQALRTTDIYTLRRILPSDRHQSWG